MHGHHIFSLPFSDFTHDSYFRPENSISMKNIHYFYIFNKLRSITGTYMYDIEIYNCFGCNFVNSAPCKFTVESTGHNIELFTVKLKRYCIVCILRKTYLLLFLSSNFKATEIFPSHYLTHDNTHPEIFLGVIPSSTPAPFGQLWVLIIKSGIKLLNWSAVHKTTDDIGGFREGWWSDFKRGHS